MNRVLIILASVVMAFSVSAARADVKIGVIDMEQIMSKSTQADKLRKDLETRFNPRKDEVQKLSKAFQDDVEKLKRDAAVMSKADQGKLEAKLTKQQQEIQQKQMTLQREVVAAQQEAQTKLIDSLKKVVKEVATAEKLNFVLIKQAAIFNDESFDITAKVLKKMGA